MDQEQQKNILRYSLQDSRPISVVFPSVEQITIEYTNIHVSSFGSRKESASMTYDPVRECVFEIDCLNNECSVGYFDLKSEIYEMFRVKDELREGTLRCKGCEAPDHQYQRCGSSLSYKINIKYRKK